MFWYTCCWPHLECFGMCVAARKVKHEQGHKHTNSKKTLVEEFLYHRACSFAFCYLFVTAMQTFRTSETKCI